MAVGPGAMPSGPNPQPPLSVVMLVGFTRTEQGVVGHVPYRRQPLELPLTR